MFQRDVYLKELINKKQNHLAITYYMNKCWLFDEKRGSYVPWHDDPRQFLNRVDIWAENRLATSKIKVLPKVERTLSHLFAMPTC